MRNRHEEHKVKNTKQVMPVALLRMQVVNVLFFSNTAGIYLCVLLSGLCADFS